METMEEEIRRGRGSLGERDNEQKMRELLPGGD